MSSQQVKKFTKLINDTIKNGILIPEENNSIRNIVSECEENGKLFTYKNVFISPVKTFENGIECLRIIFTLKEDDGSKVQNIETITTIVKDMESILVYLSGCKQTKIDNFIYLDITKQLTDD